MTRDGDQNAPASARKTESSSPSSRVSRFMDNFPNDYVEKTEDVHEGGVPRYDDAIGRNFQELSAAGRTATLLQYVTVLVAVIAIVTSRALAGAEVGFTVNKPTYKDYVALEEDTDVLNLQCDTSNSTLVYRDFADVTYEQSGVCDWVVADLQKGKLRSDWSLSMTLAGTPYSWPLALKSLMGNASACKQSAKSLYMCQMVKKNCEKGKSQVDALVERVLSASLALPTLVSRTFLAQTLNIQTNLTVQASLDGARDAQETVTKWASENMPVLYGYLQNHMNAIQALRYNTGDDAVLRGVVGVSAGSSGECPNACLTTIGNGVCNSACDVPECLYDGGDCTTLGRVLSSGPNVEVDVDPSTYEFTKTFGGFSAVALGNAEDVNPDYASHCVNSTVSGTYCGDFALLSMPSDVFNHFDDDVCANSATWSERVTVDRTWGQIKAQREWGEYSFYENLFTFDNVEIPENKPDGNPPYATTYSFTCDRFLNRLSMGGYDDFTAEKMMEWSNHYKAMSRKVVDACDGTADDFSDGCNNAITFVDSTTYDSGLQWLASMSEQEFFLEVELGAVINMAIENSGSLNELALDASLKKNASSGFAIFPTVNHEKYFEYAGVGSCKYTKKLKPEPGAFTAVVLGVIGGIANLSTYIGMGFYAFSKKRILKRDAAATRRAANDSVA